MILPYKIFSTIEIITIRFDGRFTAGYLFYILDGVFGVLVLIHPSTLVYIYTKNIFTMYELQIYKKYVVI